MLRKMAVEHPLVSDEANPRATAGDVLRDSAEDFRGDVELLKADFFLREENRHFVVNFHQRILRSVDGVEPYLKFLSSGPIVRISYLDAALHSWFEGQHSKTVFWNHRNFPWAKIYNI